MAVKPNCVCIIPPNRYMIFQDCMLHLLKPTEPRGHHLPIDFFLRYLAQDKQEQAIGIILSSTVGSLGYSLPFRVLFKFLFRLFFI